MWRDKLHITFLNELQAVDYLHIERRADIFINTKFDNFSITVNTFQH